MSFKEYLSEIPHWNVERMKVNCPEGDVIDSTNSDYHYDMAYEFIKDPKLKKKLMLAQSPIRRKFEGILPFYCTKHDILFLYDFDKGIHVPSEHDMDTLHQVQKAMWSHVNYKNKNIKIFR